MPADRERPGNDAEKDVKIMKKTTIIHAFTNATYPSDSTRKKEI
jgi:hypothetical protein